MDAHNRAVAAIGMSHFISRPDQ